jgi:MoaA/NifB/PqqE/SkfB family radical SAM enzyme
MKNINKNKKPQNQLDLTSKTINFLLDHPSLRKISIKIFNKWLSKKLLSDQRFPAQAQKDKLDLAKSITNSIDKIITEAKNNPEYQDPSIKSFLAKIPRLIKEAQKKKKIFRNKYGFNPPGFLVIGPGKFCNLKCTGCYANSSSAASEKLDWNTVNRIIKEKTESWGSWFTVITGGEPFLWQSKNRGLIELAQKHPDNLFLVYTNSTLIDKKTAQKLAEVGNVIPAISVEGFEKETDERRGKGTHKKIRKAFDNLNKAGVFWGISLTATRKTAELITSEKLMNYYFKKGASHAWIFQLMPIGRGQINLMVSPKQRLKMFYRVHHLIKKRKYPIIDFWNSGPILGGCISAGRANNGYLYIEWNGNVTPCTFVPYAGANINQIYQKGGHLDDVLKNPFFQRIRKWQKDYALDKKPEEMGNWILPCPIRDHYQEMKKFLEKDRPKPIDKQAQKALASKKYKEEMIKYDQKIAKLFNPIWEKKYLKSKKEPKNKNS